MGNIDSDTIGTIFVIGVMVAVALLAIYGLWKGSQYMKEQREKGTDKNRMMEVMALVMKEKLNDYTYAVGNYTKTERYGRTTTYYYYSYILAFNESELAIFPFVVKNKEIILRNSMAINWNEVKFSYKTGKKGMDMTITLAGEKLMINVPKVQKSSGVEKSAEPIGVYQEAEVEKLMSYLPQYKSYAAK